MIQRQLLKFHLKMLRKRLYEISISAKEFCSVNCVNKANRMAYLERGILVAAHTVERSMSFRNSQPGHSVNDVVFLQELFREWIDKGYELTDYLVNETVGVLDAYYDYQGLIENASVNIQNAYKDYQCLLKTLSSKTVLQSKKSGAYRLEGIDGEYISFKHLVASRKSIRMFRKESILPEDVMEAIRIANYSPTACNRQPNKVYSVLSSQMKSKVDKILPRNKTFIDEIQGYLVVTTRRNLFAGTEFLQWYINGGIYLGYLSLALHSIGIGACIMQWKPFERAEKQLKNCLSIPPNEAIIAIVGIGYYDNDTVAIFSQRKDCKDTSVVL